MRIISLTRIFLVRIVVIHIQIRHRDNYLFSFSHLRYLPRNYKYIRITLLPYIRKPSSSVIFSFWHCSVMS